MKNFSNLPDFPEYEYNVTNYRSYEYAPGDEKTNSYRDALNNYVGIGSGREFAQKLGADIWNIRRNADIAMCIFSDGEVKYHGRECMTRGLVNFDIAADMAYQAMKLPYFVPVTFNVDGRIIECWHTETGKIANEGHAIVKDTSAKVYKRKKMRGW